MDKKEQIYGTRAVIEAMKAGRDIEVIFIQDGVRNDLMRELTNEARKVGVPFKFVPEQKLTGLTGKNHQGVIAMVAAVHFESLENIVHGVFARGEDPLVLILDRITDVRNFGGMVRTCDAAGVHAILVPEKNSAPLSSDAMKTSAGALNHVPVCRTKSLRQSIKELKNSGLKIVACTEKAADTIFQTDLTGPLAIIMGSEEDGITPELLKEAHHLALIPMAGKIKSLNVSVAAGIALFEAVRQKGVK